MSKYTIRPLGCTSYSETDDALTACQDHLSAMRAGLQNVVIVDEDGEDVTDELTASWLAGDLDEDDAE